MIKTANLTGSVSRNAGGMFESVRRLVQSLHDTGMKVCMFGTEDANTAADIGAWAPVEVRAFRPLWPQKIGYSSHFLPALEEFNPDLTHTHGIWLYSSVVTNQYSRRKGSPYVISAHGMLDPWAVQNSRWRKAIAYFLYEETHLREAACLRALCESEARAIRQLGLKNPIAIIPNGIDLPDVGRKAEIAPWKNCVEPQRKVLLFLSRIHPKKGLVNLIKAWAEVERQLKIGDRQSQQWVLAIAGWDQGGHEDDLKRLATEMGIPWGDVRAGKSEGHAHVSLLFLGPQFNEGKTACYANCDAFVLPSFSEGVPMVVLEAWAHGKPVLMTPECNLPQGFSRNAAIKIETSVAGIVAGLSELHSCSNLQMNEMGANGHGFVREQFVWPKVAQDMAGLYEWLLGRGPAPSCVADF